ncbi:EP1-like glycoprotein 3 [Citrus sinensis]|uniref:EP1-like glycoprotein 3 n=1 Tax=Citrus sinensis TaxID=2711 RepID=A0ACB8M147_CITSI|nr:EP1-like glycoprotein 3 [Citrus sinensis]
MEIWVVVAGEKIDVATVIPEQYTLKKLWQDVKDVCFDKPIKHANEVRVYVMLPWETSNMHFPVPQVPELDWFAFVKVNEFALPNLNAEIRFVVGCSATAVEIKNSFKEIEGNEDDDSTAGGFVNTDDIIHVPGHENNEEEVESDVNLDSEDENVQAAACRYEANSDGFKFTHDGDNIILRIGQLFKTIDEFRNVVKVFAIKNGFRLKRVKNEKTNVQVPGNKTFEFLNDKNLVHTLMNTTQITEFGHLQCSIPAKTSKQVCRNATFSLGSDGNLVLAEADSTVVCQSNTANKGVVGFKLLPNGNMVLHDSKGNFIWQSFDYPTDALLVGQSLLSVKENVSFVMEPKRFTLYYKGSNSPQPVLYHDSPLNGEHDPSVQNLTFNSRPETDEAFAYELTLDISDSGSDILDRPKYNIRSSFLRLGMHGNLKIYTHYDKVDSQPTQVTFTFFVRDFIFGKRVPAAGEM